MHILIALLLIIILSGGAWILNYEKQLVPNAPCRGQLDGHFIAKKDCDEYWKETGDKPKT